MSSWMAFEPTVEQEATLQVSLLQLKNMPEAQLRANVDTLARSYWMQQLVLRQAMRRIAELELQRAMADPDAMAAQLRREQNKLGGFLNRLRRRWGG